MNGAKGVGKVGKCNLGFRQEQLTSHAGTVLVQDFVERLGVARVLDEELQVKVRERGDRERIPDAREKSLRADSGFYSKAVVEWGEAHGFTWTITGEQPAPFLAASAALAEQSWQLLPEYELADGGRTRYRPTGWSRAYRYGGKRERAETKTGEL